MLAALVLALLAVQEPVKVGASLSANRIRVGETTVLQVSVETRGDNAESIELPELPAALAIATTQDFSQLQITYPGGRSRVMRRDIVLEASAAGEYRIGTVAVRVQGRTYTTRPLTLLVLPARPGERLVPGGSDVRLRAWLEPDTAYVGEQVLLHAEALFPQDLRLRQSRPASYDVPTPTDFWVQDLPESLSLGLRSIDGEVHETQTFRRAYFGLTPGQYRLPPARLLYEIRRGFLYAPESRTITSDSLRITVLPVPLEGQPASFTGAVGRYTMDAHLEPATIAAGEAATLTVEIRGEGNVKALPPPRLPDLPNVEVFPPTEDSQPETVDEVVRGVKRFTWVLIPEHAGTLRLPALEYAFFDPGTRAYEVARAEPLALTVSPSGAASTHGVTLRDILEAPAGDRLGWVRSPLFAAAQLVPLLAILGALAVRRGGRQRQPSRRQRRAARNARIDALEALVPVEADRSFFGQVAAFVRDCTAESLARPEIRSTPAAAFHRALEETGIAAGTRADLSELLARLDHARFAPEAPTAAERRTLLKDAVEILERIEREGRPARRRRPPASAAAAALLLAAVAALPALAQEREQEFAAGVAAYRDARFAESAAQFARYVADHPGDANGWYDLGNAYFASGDRGRAIWSWLTAIRAHPRFDAARHNLAAVGADETLRWLPPPFAIGFREALVALALCWWLAGFALAIAIAKRRQGWFFVAAAAIVPALIATAAALPASLRGPAAVTIEEATPLLAGPALRAEEIRALPQAVLLAVVEERGDWLRVRTADDTEGWVEAARVGQL
jgi:TolA-binding protein